MSTRISSCHRLLERGMLTLKPVCLSRKSGIHTSPLSSFAQDLERSIYTFPCSFVGAGSQVYTLPLVNFNGVAIPVRRSNQLSYEATDVGSWSFVSSNEPMKNGCEVILYEMFHILNFGFEIK